MKKLALSIGLLLNIAPIFSAQLLTSNLGPMIVARPLNDKDSSIVVECDTDDIDTIQSFEASEVVIVLGDGSKTLSPIYLSKDNKLSVKIKEESVTIGSVNENKNLSLAQGLLPQYTIENANYVLKLHFPAIDR